METRAGVARFDLLSDYRIHKYRNRRNTDSKLTLHAFLFCILVLFIFAPLPGLSLNTEDINSMVEALATGGFQCTECGHFSSVKQNLRKHKACLQTAHWLSVLWEEVSFQERSDDSHLKISQIKMMDRQVGLSFIVKTEINLMWLHKLHIKPCIYYILMCSTLQQTKGGNLEPSHDPS